MTGYDNPRPISELIERLNAQSSADMKTCMVTGLNAFMQSLALLGKKPYANERDLDRLLQMFALIESAAPSAPSPADYAPRPNGGQMPPIYRTQTPTENPSAARFVEGLARDLGVPER